jgi:adenosylcobinamide kinase/adenosylcobinamide-phosphate guanylyltransferase
MAELILGGARSGKSALAEARAGDSGLEVVYVATGEAQDAEMLARIAHHRARRPPHWATVEAPLHLAATLQGEAMPGRLLLVDCLTLWLSNLLFYGQPQDGSVDEQRFAAESAALLETLPDLPGRVLLVSNEVGCGIVPMNALARRFADEQGRLNQRVAALCSRVTLVAAGLPLELKESRR